MTFSPRLQKRLNRRVYCRNVIIERVLAEVCGPSRSDCAYLRAYLQGMIGMAYHAEVLTEREYDALWAMVAKCG